MATFYNTFFSFHYADATLAAQVRQSNFLRGRGNAGYQDWSDWETIRRSSPSAIKQWIEDQLTGSTVTVVLIGKHTAEREWVKYEIQRSHERRKGLLGIYMNKMRGFQQYGLSPRGPNPFEKVERTNFPRTKGILEGMSQRSAPSLGLADLARNTPSASGLFGLGSGILNDSARQPTSSPGGLLGLGSGILSDSARSTSSFGLTRRPTLADIVPTYCWVDDDGYNNLGAWIQLAASRA